MSTEQPIRERFVFKTGVDKPKQRTLYASSIQEATDEARRTFPNAQLIRIEST